MSGKTVLVSHLRVPRRDRADPSIFVGTVSLQDDVVETAANMRRALKFYPRERENLKPWGGVFRVLVESSENAGVLVMANNAVGNNTNRKLDPAEFRGFSLADKVAPVVFLNTGAAKATHIFMLAHELARVWLGESGLSDDEARTVRSSLRDVEDWCNQVAMEFLVSLNELRKAYDENNDVESKMRRLAKLFKLSMLVILRRMRDTGGLSREEMSNAYKKEAVLLIAAAKTKQEENRKEGKSGGNF